jgi:hypothetical protein
LRIVYVWGFGWEIDYAAVSRRAPIPLSTSVARSERYCPSSKDRFLSPRKIRNFFIAVRWRGGVCAQRGPVTRSGLVSSSVVRSERSGEAALRVAALNAAPCRMQPWHHRAAGHAGERGWGRLAPAGHGVGLIHAAKERLRLLRQAGVGVQLQL